MTNGKFAHRIVHYCRLGEVCQLEGRYLPDAEEYRAYCDHCESYVYGNNGVEHP